MDPTLRDVWDGIRTQPGRVGLSFLAIGVGIASLSILMAVLGGLWERSQQIVQELGVNVIGILRQGEAGRNAVAGLQERDASLLARNLPECTVSTIRLYKVPTLGTRALLSVVATDSSLIRVKQWKLDTGRFLDHRDIENRERNAVVSRSLGTLWNWRVGDLIMLSDLPFRIVGIVSVASGALDPELGDLGLMLGERVVLIPKTITPYWVTDQEPPEPVVDAILLRVPTFLSLADVLSAAQRLLSQSGDRMSHISWVTPESLIRGLKKLQNTIQLTVGGVALLCLALGGTTLMSLMVANVRERVTEIGLRRAMGASQWDVAVLFVLEACVVTGAAAATATLGTHLLLIRFREALPVPLKLGSTSIAVPLCVAIILGMIFSYWPAMAAAKIMPAEALRNE